MGTMNKLRENTGVVLWILVISFGVIWVLQDSGAFNATGGLPAGGNIATVNGDPISYEEYNRALNAQIEAYQQQTGETMPPQRVDQTRNAVFEGLIENKLREQEMDRLGIVVTDDEVFDLVFGERPHQIITAYFGDGQGNVDKAIAQSFFDDPANVEQQVQIEEFLRAERRRQKLDKLLNATVRVSEQDVLDEYQKRNRKVNAAFVALDLLSIPNDSVSVTDADLRRFYNEHKDEFEQKRRYTISYVTASKTPTAEDSTLALEGIARLRDTFADADNDSVFIAQYGSERPYSSAFFRRDELDADLAELVFQNPQPGTVLGPAIIGDEVHLVKIIDTRPAEEQTVKARHILISAAEGDAPARAAALAEANRIKQQIAGGADFATLAREVSDDPGSGAQGGDLGWFGPGRMVEPFQEAAFNAPIGTVVGPVETQFGYHLIEVTARASQEVRLADFVERLRVSPSTLTAAEETLEDIAYYAEESSFAEEAAKRDMEVTEVTIEEDQSVIPRIGSSRTLMNFLDQADEGDISDVIELDNDFLIAEVKEIQPEGYRSLEEVTDEIRPRVLIAKKKEILSERMQNAYTEGMDLDALAQELGVQRRTVSGIGFNNMRAPILGRDPIFAGTILGMKQGQTSGVVEGENGVFVAQVTQVTEPAPITDTQREELGQELLTRRRAQVRNQWVSTLRDQADVEDNRRLFTQ